MDKLKSERGKRDRVQLDNDLKNEHLKKLQKKLERLIRDQTAELEAEESKTQQMSGARSPTNYYPRYVKNLTHDLALIRLGFVFCRQCRRHNEDSSEVQGAVHDNLGVLPSYRAREHQFAAHRE